MKVLLIVALASLAHCAEKSNKRSVGHYDAWQPAIVSSYTTAHELPSYVVPESTSVVSRRVVAVPVTYTQHVARPVLRRTYSVPTYYSAHPTYNYHSYATPVRSAYAYNYAPSWNYAHAW